MLRITRDIELDEKELDFRYIRSSGPGGQNVNKVSTAAELHFNAAASNSLPQRVRLRLLRLAGKRANKRGEIILVARNRRSREQNRKEVLDRLLRMIREAARTTEPRIPVRRPQWVDKKRVEEKRRRSILKAQRKNPT